MMGGSFLPNALNILLLNAPQIKSVWSITVNVDPAQKWPAAAVSSSCPGPGEACGLSGGTWTPVLSSLWVVVEVPQATVNSPPFFLGADRFWKLQTSGVSVSRYHAGEKLCGGFNRNYHLRSLCFELFDIKITDDDLRRVSLPNRLKILC